MSYTDICDPIIMYCMGLFVVVYSKQCCLQANKYDQSLRVTNIYIHAKFNYYYVTSKLIMLRIYKKRHNGIKERETR